MKPTFIKFTLILLIISIAVAAQKNPNAEYGKVSLQELSKTKYEIDSTADAIVLYEKAESYFVYDDNIGFQIETEYFIRKKILKPSAFELGIIKVPLYKNAYNESQVLRNLKGTTYWMKNGGLNKIEISKKDIFEEKLTNTYYQTKVTFPNVVEGCIIEYSYIITTPMRIRDKPEIWYFQGNIPTLWSQYNLTVPSYLYYQIILGGYLPLVENSSEKATVSMGNSKLDTYGTKYSFSVANAPAFRTEPYISTKNDYISKIEFELSSTSIPESYTKNYSLNWEDINKTLSFHDNFGIKLKKSNYLKEIVSNFAAIKNPAEKLQKVYYYMAKQVETDYSHSSIYAGDLKKVLENKKGTASEQNLMLTALLREMDFKATPVILSTRDNGKINQAFPLLDKFNYTICRVELDGKFYNLDLSDQNLKMGMLPYECLNGDGREINNQSGNFVDLKPNEKYKNYEVVEAKIDPKSGKMIGKIEENSVGYFAYSRRKELKKYGIEEFKKSYQKEFQNISVFNLELQNFEEIEKLSIIKMNFESNDEFAGEDMIYLNPMIRGKVSENPFKLPERSYPVDFGYGTDLTYKYSLEIPKDFEVESLPKNSNVVLSDKSAQFIYNCTFDQNTNKINLISKIVLKNPIYYAEQYHELKELYNIIVQKHDEQIVLKRK
ncbi:DUF3857 domain-containing protein [Lacihabitans sp. LS3-19]|uniref:transglutaminase domain-containing protein n=1 Tax=Lacihabitans sp. LS3-19 TaxID=2487335 RepID=UPI0020CFCD28|nr:transglutaminase domain-containing protein [Lacihabitans sp. LS3-19]MCP9770950.1 DUF3857 domain-containing protein [Lacihabitans sp. LS3-19]